MAIARYGETRPEKYGGEASIGVELTQAMDRPVCDP